MCKSYPIAICSVWPKNTAIVILLWLWAPTVLANNKMDTYRPYIEKIRQSMLKNPRSARLHTILGRLYQKAGDCKQANSLYRKALTLTPDYSHALVGLADCAMARHQVVVAQTLLRRVLQKTPQHAPALALSSELYRYKASQSRSPEKRRALLMQAVSLLQRAIRNQPRSHNYLYRLGLLYVGLQQHILAHQQFAKAVALQKDFPCYQVGFRMTEALLLGKETSYQRLETMLSSCSHALMAGLSHQVWMAHQVKMAHQQSARGEQTAAIKRLQRAIELAPKTTSGYLYLTLLLSQDRQCQKARQVLELLLSHHPTHTEAKTLLRHPKALHCQDRESDSQRGHIRILRVSPHKSVSPLFSPPTPRRTTTP